MDLPLNALRAFEVSARHLNFTRAAEALNLTQTAVSQHVRNLEARIGVPLFRRVPRGLALTAAGEALLPVLSASFSQIAATLVALRAPVPRAPLAVGVVSSFAVGWLLPRLHTFRSAHPEVDLSLFTHNNLVDLAGEGLDFALRFGNGRWHNTEATPVLTAPLTPLCAPPLAARLASPADLAGFPLLRSYRVDEWSAWFRTAGLAAPVVKGMVFDSSLALAEAAALGEGVALLPSVLFARELATGRLVRPFAEEVSVGSYWLTWLASRPLTPAMVAFSRWLLATTELAPLAP